MKTYLKFACIYCGQHMECNPVHAGRQMLCPVCMHQIVIPTFRNGGPPQQATQPPHTWDYPVPFPSVEAPTRYRRNSSLNPVLAQCV